MSRRRWLIVAGAVLIVALAGGGAAWWYVSHTGAKTIVGSPTVEFHPDIPPAPPRPPKAVLSVPWPTYGYDAQRDRLAPFNHRPPYRRIWALRAGYYLEFPPTIGYGRVFIGQGKGRFFALDPATGKIVWQKRFRFCSASSPTLTAGLVIQTYIPSPCGKVSRTLPGLVIALRASDGKVVWQRSLASESTPVVVGDRAYLGAWDGRVYALAVKTGKIIWSTATDGEIDGSPAYAAGVIYIGNNAGSVYAIGARTGAVRWVGRSFSSLFRGREYFYATPAVAYGRVFAPNTDGTVYAFGATTGHLLWARQVGTYVYTAPAIWRQKVYVGTYDGKFVALDAATGNVRWEVETVSSVHGAPTVMAGLVYFSTCGSCGSHGVRHAKLGPRGTYALDARTGKLVWSFPDGHYSPITADGQRVYLAGNTILYGLVSR